MRIDDEFHNEIDDHDHDDHFEIYEFHDEFHDELLVKIMMNFMIEISVDKQSEAGI